MSLVSVLGSLPILPLRSRRSREERVGKRDASLISLQIGQVPLPFPVFLQGGTLERPCKPESPQSEPPAVDAGEFERKRTRIKRGKGVDVVAAVALDPLLQVKFSNRNQFDSMRDHSISLNVDNKSMQS